MCEIAFTNPGQRNCSQHSSTTATSIKHSAERLLPIAHTHLQFPYNPHYIILSSPLLGISKLLSFSELHPPNSCPHLSALYSLPLTLSSQYHTTCTNHRHPYKSPPPVQITVTCTNHRHLYKSPSPVQITATCTNHRHPYKSPSPVQITATCTNHHHMYKSKVPIHVIS
jgi:hypothetical protein